MFNSNSQHKKTRKYFSYCHSGQAGFTLIEVLVVIAVLAIISAIFVSQTNFFQQSAKLSSVSRDLISDIRYAQQLAVNEQINYGIRFFISENKYQLWRFATSSEQIFEKNLPDEVQLSQIFGLSDDQVKFNGYGAALEEGSIYLVNSKNETKIIDIRPSGFVKLYEM